MWDEYITEIRRLNELKNITNEEIIPFIEIALDELDGVSIKAGKEIKAVAFMTLGLLGQKLWHKIQQRANEYDETLETFKDLKYWEEYWQARCDALIAVPSAASMTKFNFGAV